MITRLRIKNFRSIRSTEFVLAPLTVLVGPNNAGKTNILRALELLGNSVLGLGTQPRSGAHYPLPAHPKLERDINWAAGDAPLEISAETPDGWVHLTFRRGAPDEDTGRLHASASGEPSAGPVGDVEQEARVFAQVITTPVHAFELGRLREPVHFQENTTVLRSDGRGLALFLFDLQERHPERWESFLAEYRELVPEIRRIAFRREPVGQLSLAFWEEGAETSHSIAEVSDGLALLAAILALRHGLAAGSIHTARRNGGTEHDAGVLLLEDPERGVHPLRLEEITDTLYAATEPDARGRRAQIVLTSHSPYFLDRFKDVPESIVIVDRDPQQGTTGTSLVDRLADLPEFREKSLGELWYTGLLGGVPDPIAS